MEQKLATLSTVKDAVSNSHNARWRWGLGAVLGIPIITFFLIEGRTDRTYMRDTFTNSQNKLVKSLDGLGDSVDSFGHALNQQCVIDRQLKTEFANGFRRMTKENDDIGDALRMQVKQFDRLIEVVEREHALNKRE